MLRLASALSSLPTSLQPCSGLQNSIGPTKIRLWLILDKHFIAKPARTTSLPRFVSDTIYEMGTEMKGRFTSALSACHTFCASGPMPLLSSACVEAPLVTTLKCWSGLPGHFRDHAQCRSCGLSSASVTSVGVVSKWHRSLRTSLLCQPDGARHLRHGSWTEPGFEPGSLGSKTAS